MADWVYDENCNPVPDCKRCPRRDDDSPEQYADCQDCYVSALTVDLRRNVWMTS